MKHLPGNAAVIIIVNCLLLGCGDQTSSAEQLAKAEGSLEEGRYSDAILELENSASADPQSTYALVENARLALIESEADAARALLDQALAIDPEYVPAWSLLGRVYLGANQYDNAREAFSTVLKLSPGDPDASQSLAFLATKNKDYETARRYYAEVLEHHENNLPTLMQLARLDSIQGDKTAMLGHLNQAITAHPKAVEPRLALARYHLTQRDADKASIVLSELSDSDRNLPSALSVLATTQLAQQDHSAARYSLEQLVQLQPNISQHHYLLAMAYAGLGERDKMQQELETVVELAPRNVQGRVALARLLQTLGESERFEEQVNALQGLQPDHPDVLLLRASLASQQDKQQEALELWEIAYAKGPTQKTVLLLVRQRWLLGDRGGAIGTLKEWVANHPRDTTSRLALADLYTADNRIDSAIEQYAAIVEVDDRNELALNNLAWHLRDNDPVKALSYAEQASEINRNSADILDTLAIVLMKNRKLERAQSTIDRALAISPDRPRLLYHSAIIKNEAGDAAGAIQILGPLVNTEKRFAEKEEAAQLLTSLQR